MSENTRPRGSPSPFFDQNHLHVTSNPNYNATASTSAIGKGLLDFRDSGRTSSTSLTTQQHHQRDRVLSDRNGMNSLFPNVASTKKSGFSEEDDRVDEEDEEETSIVGPFDFSSIKESTPPPPSSSLPPSSSPYASSVHDETPIHEVTPVAQRRVDFSALASAKKGRSTKKVKGSAKKNTTTTKKSVNPTTTQEGNDNDSATIDNVDKEKPGQEMMLGLDLDVSMVISPDSSNGTHVEERIQVQQQRMQLISPPPEETLGALRRLSWGKPPAAATTLDDKDSDIKTPVTNIAPASATKRKRGTPRVGGKQKQAAAPTVSVIEEEDGDVRMRNTVNASEEDNEAATGRTREEEEEPVEATPNPKPRKLGRRMINMEDEEDQDGDEDSAGLLTTPTKSKTKAKSVLIQSPHVANPEADYVPPLVLPAAEGAVARRAVLGARGSRRSATPIPPYEPPEDVFTPPREVWSPAPVTTSRRSATPSGGRTGKGKAPASATTSAKKSGAKGKGKTALKIVTQVKQELPDIDLTAPMPPPSPTDDPLLLSGPPEEFRMIEEERREIPRMMSVEAQVQTDDIEGGVDTGGAWEERDGEEQGPAVDVLPPSSPEPYFDSDDMRVVDAFESERERRDQGTSGMPSSIEEEDSMMDDDPVAQGVSPVRLFEGEAGAGAETGGWSDSDEEEDRRVIGEQIEEGEGEYTGHFRTLRIPTKEDPPSSATRARQEEWGRPISPYPYKRLSLVAEQKQEEEKEKEKEPQVLVEEEEDEEEREVREMSLTLEEEPEAASQQVHEEALPEEEAPEDSEDSDMENDPGLVKITSADPRAAARAAAILKQHDYDCFTKIAMKKRRQRASHSTVDSLIKNARKRDLVGSAGITKSSKAKAQRRSFAFTGGVVDGERVVIPGSPSTTLPELLYEAEQEVSRVMMSLPSPGRAASPNWSMTSIDRPQQNPFLTPAPRLRPSISSSATVYRDTIGPDFIGEAPWTKEEWKLLDACFTDERLEVGEKMLLEGTENVEYEEDEEVLAPVDMVRVEDVVERFVTFIGGRDVAERRGEAWARTNLIERARALQKKQRAGNVAKPTTPRSSMSNSSFAGISPPLSHSATTPDALGGARRNPRMEVPDFTPLRRPGLMPGRTRTLSLQKPVLQGPSLASSETVTPPTLMAPRYSHLMEEARKIGQEGQFRIEIPSVSSASAPAEDPVAVGNDSNDVSMGEDINADETRVVEMSTMDLDMNLPPPSTPNVKNAPQEPPSTLTKRVTGFLFSYLPTLSRTASANSSTTFSSARPTISSTLKKPTAAATPKQTRQPGLPLPPPEVLERPRLPVRTPAKKALLPPQAPRDTVRLNHTASGSAIPRPIRKEGQQPKRLVELHHLELPEEIPKNTLVKGKVKALGPRGSVRDLVGAFEEMQRVEREEAEKSRRLGKKRVVKPVGGAAGGQGQRPVWRF